MFMNSPCTYTVHYSINLIYGKHSFIHLPCEHIELSNLARKTLKLVKTTTIRILFLSKNEDTITIKYWVKYCCKLFGKLKFSLGPNLNLGKDTILIQASQDNTGVVPFLSYLKRLVWNFETILKTSWTTQTKGQFTRCMIEIWRNEIK